MEDGIFSVDNLHNNDDASETCSPASHDMDSSDRSIEPNDEETSQDVEEKDKDHKSSRERKKHLNIDNDQLKVGGDNIKQIPREIKDAVKNPQKTFPRCNGSKKPSVSITSVGASASKLVDIIDTIDREGKAYTHGLYSESGTYAHGGEDKPGKRIPKAGAYAAAGVGKARAEFSVFEAEANGPNASAGAEASVTGVGAMARAEVGSVSASAGPVTVKLGLGLDTGVSAGVDGVEAKILGFGFKIGPRTSISLLGSEVECVIM